MVINRLQKAFRGELELTDIQVKIGFGLLAKVLPDLARIEHTGEDGNPIEFRAADELSDEMLARVVVEGTCEVVDPNSNVVMLPAPEGSQ